MSPALLPCAHCGGQTGHATCHACGTHIAGAEGQFWTNPAVDAKADAEGTTPEYGEDDVRLYCDACYPKAQP